MPKFCPNCGNSMSDYAQFCMSCGTRLEDFRSSNPIGREPTGELRKCGCENGWIKDPDDIYGIKKIKCPVCRGSRWVRV